MLEVDCPPAMNTEYNIQGPLVEATWEFQSLKVGAKQTGCYRVVLYRNQSVVFYEKMKKSPHRVISTRLLVNTSMSVAECDNSFMVAFNTTRSSTCCQYGYLQLLAVNPDNGSLILHQLAAIPFAHHWANGKSATCSVTGSNGRTASSSFTITTQNGESNCLHCICGYIMCTRSGDIWIAVVCSGWFMEGSYIYNRMYMCTCTVLYTPYTGGISGCVHQVAIMMYTSRQCILARQL